VPHLWIQVTAPMRQRLLGVQLLRDACYASFARRQKPIFTRFRLQATAPMRHRLLEVQLDRECCVICARRKPSCIDFRLQVTAPMRHRLLEVQLFRALADKSRGRLLASALIPLVDLMDSSADLGAHFKMINLKA